MRDWFTNAFGAAVADIRRELVENAWFGRPEPRHFGQHSQGDTDRTPSEQLGWEHNKTTGPGHDFDR